MTENKSEKYGSIFEKAEDFHGHFGPFLVIGVRMGLTGLNRLNAVKDKSLVVAASLPPHVPFSCIIDGLQVTTKCTVGNQRLSLKDSLKIQTQFETRDGQKVVVALNQTVFEKLKSRLVNENLPEEEVRQLAWDVAAIPEDELFIIT